MDTFLATKAEMHLVARAQMKRGERQNCDTCHNSIHGGKLLPPDKGYFFPTGHGLFWNCHSCVDAATCMTARDRKRQRDSMEHNGLPRISPFPVPLPPTKWQTRRRMPQYCGECNNGWGGRVLLASDQGQFLIDHRGERWVCHRCIDQSNCAACRSPEEKQLHAWLVSEHISHRMHALIGGELWDCHIHPWNMLIEFGIRSAHHTAPQSKKDRHRNRIAWEQGVLLFRVQWDDPDFIARIRAARKFGLSLRERRASSSPSPAYRHSHPLHEVPEREGFSSDTPPEDAPWL